MMTQVQNEENVVVATERESQKYAITGWDDEKLGLKTPLLRGNLCLTDLRNRVPSKKMAYML